MIRCAFWLTVLTIATPVLGFSDHSSLADFPRFDSELHSAPNTQNVPTFNAPRQSGGESTRYGVRQELCPTGIEPQRNKDGNIMWCRVDDECRSSYECIPIVGLFHFGNAVKYCCPTKSSYCTHRPPPLVDVSTCTKPSITLYYFDVSRRKCRPYAIAGCSDLALVVDEVQNRFGSLKDCRARCETTACDIGETPLYRDNDLDQPFLCENSEQCPHGYTCRLDRLFRRQVCCGKSQFDACPNLRTFVVPFTGGPKQCNANNREKDECPSGFVCTKNAVNFSSYCCANMKGVCPPGQKPFIHSLTASIVKCDVHSYDASCPRSFVCASMVAGSSWGFCCSQSIVTNCPHNSKPFISITTGLPEKCTVGVTICRHGYKCLNSEQNSRTGFCCTPPSSIELIYPLIPRPRPTTWAPRSSSLETAETPEESGSHGSEDRSGRSLTTTVKPTTLSPIASLEFSTENKNSERRKEKTIRKKILQVINTLTCPEDFEPMVYPGTELILHCTRGHRHDCPTPSKCLKAVDDVLERALCCVHEDDKSETRHGGSSDSHEGGTSKIGEENVQLGESSDPACPTIILSRSCTPASPHICHEDGFFCQFNRQFNEYLCCSMYRIQN